MWALFSALIPLLGGVTRPIKEWFDYLQSWRQKSNDLQIAILDRQIREIESNNEADTLQRQNYLTSVTMAFRQQSFYIFMVPFIISILAPDYARYMWDNFNAIPADFRKMFFLIYGVIWGLPIAKEHFGSVFSSIGRGIQLSRDFKLEKAKVDRAIVFKTLKDAGIFNGSPNEVKAIDNALDAGEAN